MCHEHDSAPPVPVLRGAAVSHERLELEAADGNRFAAFLAEPEERGDAGVVILPDVRGLYRFYEELALRFAERGLPAIAFDYYGRTAGPGPRGDDFDWAPHREQTTDQGVQADVAAAVARLDARATFTVGFCFGGRASWVAAAEHALAGAVGFYGRPPFERAGDIRTPILALMGGADQGIPRDQAEEWDRVLDGTGVDHEVVIYDGAPHSFFDRKQEEFQEASDDAWRRALAFIQRYA